MPQNNVTLTAAPQLVAVGEGNAMIQGLDTTVSYWIGDTNTQGNAMPFTAHKDVREPMFLAQGEGLWVAGSGIAIVYAQVEPT